MDVDPHFVDPYNLDFRLDAFSPAIDRAMRYPFDRTTDIDDNPDFDDRFVQNLGVGIATTRDMGAFERQSSSPFEVEITNPLAGTNSVQSRTFYFSPVIPTLPGSMPSLPDVDYIVSLDGQGFTRPGLYLALDGTEPNVVGLRQPESSFNTGTLLPGPHTLEVRSVTQGLWPVDGGGTVIHQVVSAPVVISWTTIDPPPSTGRIRNKVQ